MARKKVKWTKLWRILPAYVGKKFRPSVDARILRADKLKQLSRESQHEGEHFVSLYLLTKACITHSFGAYTEWTTNFLIGSQRLKRMMSKGKPPPFSGDFPEPPKLTKVDPLDNLSPPPEDSSPPCSDEFLDRLAKRVPLEVKKQFETEQDDADERFDEKIQDVCEDSPDPSNKGV